MSEIPIWPVLRHYGWELPRDLGRWQTIKCGEHDDSHGSCRITSVNGGYVNCLGCGFKGDAIDIVKYYERLEFRDAKSRAEDIARSGGFDVPETARPGRRSTGLSATSRVQSRSGKYVPPRRRTG